MAVQTPARITAQAFYQRPEYAQHDLIQLIDGEVIIGVPPIPLHQQIVLATAILLKQAAAAGGQVYVAPVEMFFDEYNSLQPDVLYIAPQSRCIVEDKRLVGPPDLVVEVLSPSTVRHDKTVKFLVYEKNGVSEYWLVDPTHRLLEVWRLEGGSFAQQGVYAPADTFVSQALGQTIAAGALFAA